MSTDDKGSVCSSANVVDVKKQEDSEDKCNDPSCEKKRQKASRKVSFPGENELVTRYFEPANPWQDVPPTSKAQLAADYLESCRRHNTPPIDCVLRQIRELPEAALGGVVRAPRLSLSACELRGAAPVDALEAVLRRAQYKRIELDDVDIDDEGAEAMFDMIEYYESANVLSISGPREFGIRGWQAATRMIKRSCHLSELEISNHPVEGSHAPVLARALHAHTCRLRVLCLQRANLTADPLLCLVKSLKSNTSIRELRLGDNLLGPSDAEQIASLLRFNTRIQLLDLSNNMIQDAGCGYIAEAIAEQCATTPPEMTSSPLSPHQFPLSGYESRGLAFLVLWNNQLTRNCAHHLTRALTSGSLVVLNVGRNALGGEGARALQGRGLVSLGLQCARIGPDAAHAVHALCANTTAQRLDLRDNKLGVAGLQAILSALKENKSLTQIDLDDVESPTSPQSGDESESSIISRLTAEIRARCRENDSPANTPDRLVHRKISLTGHTACIPRPSPASSLSCAGRDSSRRGRLRSPLPSPAPSPVPHNTRFSVTRVAGERESSAPPPSPTPASSRFKVVQVAEPPQITVQPAEPRRSSSRFSVTRNYDAVYHPVTPPSSPGPPHCCPPQTTPDKTKCDRETTPDKTNCDSEITKNVTTVRKTSDNCESVDKNVKEIVNVNKYHDKSENISHSETLDAKGDDKILKTETVLVKSSKEESETEKVDVEVQVTVKTESVQCDKNKNVQGEEKPKDHEAMKQIEAITEDLGNLIQEMRDLTTKTAVLKKSRDDFNGKMDDVPANVIRDNVVLKKNKSESSLDSPDLEVSRLMNKKLTGSPFCDSSSSLEISGSSMESLAEHHMPTKPIIIQESVESDTELDRRKTDRVTLSTESSLESNASEMTPVNSSNFLNTSVSSTDSVSPIFGKTKKIHGSLSSLEASVSSLDSARQDKVMVTSADSGIEYSLQNPSESKDDNSSNEGTLTNNSSLSCKKSDQCQQDTLTSSPKRTTSLLDVPAMKSKSVDRMRKISWVAPSSSFQASKPEPEKVEIKLPSHLEKLLSLFQHPTSLFSRSTNEEERKSSVNTPPRKDSSLTSSFWSWGSATEKEKEEKEDREDSSEDSTLSERVQVSFVDESFSKKLDSKTPSTDTENTLSEFQSFPTQGNSETSDVSQTEKLEKVTDLTTDNLVQKSLVLSTDEASSNGNKEPRASDIIDLIKPNDLNKNYPTADNGTLDTEKEEREEAKEQVRPRSFAAVLKSSGSENSLEKQTSPEGQPVDKLPSKVIRGIKENISPENTLTSSMTNTKTLALELTERQIKNQPIVNAIWEIQTNFLDKDENKAPIATIEETCDESADNSVQLDYIDDIKFIDEKNISADSGVTSLEGLEDKKSDFKKDTESVDLGKDALSYLIYENQDFEPEIEPSITNIVQAGSLAQELKEAEFKEKLLDLSPELVLDEAIEVPEVFVAKDLKGLRTSPVIPERAKLKKSNSLEELSQTDDSPKTKTIAFKIPETTPRDIPERRGKLRSRSGSSPKSLPESLNKPSPLSKMECIKKRKKVSSLGKMAKDSLLALNMTEEEIAEFRRSYKLTSVESLKSLESVSEDANSQSGTSVDSRCRACFRTSQESLMSLDSITEDCRCADDCDKSEKPRSLR